MQALKYFAVLIAATPLFFLCEFAAAQRVADKAEVFGNPISKEADEWLTDSNIKFNEALVRLQKTWLTDVTRYEISLPQRTLVFFSGQRTVTFDIQVIGTVRKSDKSWEWGWNNPRFDSRLAVPAGRLSDLGRKYDLRYLTHGMLPIPIDAFPQMLCGITLKLHGGEGVYLAPSEALDVYLLLSNPRRN